MWEIAKSFEIKKVKENSVVSKNFKCLTNTPYVQLLFYFIAFDFFCQLNFD